MRIPDRPYGHIAGGRLEPSASGAAASRNFAAIAQGADAITEAAFRIRDMRDHDFLVQAQNEYSTAMNAWRQEAELDRTGGAAHGFTQDFTARHESLSKTIATQMEKRGLSRVGLSAFNEWALGRQEVGTADAARFEFRQMQAHGQDMHNLRVQSIFEQLGQHPESFADAFRQLEESYALAVGQGVYRAAEAKVRFGEAKEKMKGAAFDNLYAVNRGKAMQNLDALGFSKADKARAHKRYEADVRADAAQARAARADKLGALTTQVDDADYLARMSGDAGGLRTLADSFASLGDAERAEKLRKRADTYENNAGIIKESQAVPLPELAASIRELQNGLKTPPNTGDGTIAELAGQHRAKAEELKLRLGVYQEREKALTADPAKAVAAQALEALPDNQRENPKALTDMRLAVQENNGVPEALRKVLTKDEAAHWQEQWRNGDLQTRLNIAHGLEVYGPHAGAVAGEIGLTPTEQIVLQQARNSPEALGALQTVITAAAAAPDALPKLEKADEKLRTVIEESEVLQGFRAAAAAMPGVAGIQGITRDLENTAGKLLRMTGGDTEAVKKTLDGRLHSLVDGKNFALVFDADPDDVEWGLREIMDGPALAELAKSPTRPDAFSQQDWLSHMRRAGVWLPGPTGGFMFVDPVGQVPLLRPDGSLFVVHPEELRGAASRNPARRQENDVDWDDVLVEVTP